MTGNLRNICNFWSLVVLLSITGRGLAQDSLGMFSAHQDIGDTGRPGSVELLSNVTQNPGSGETAPTANGYIVSGGGANMWAKADAFHYVYKKIEGDFSIAADIQIQGEGGDPHRKAALLIRQSLDPDSAYADAVIHGDGLTSLQYRDEKGGVTREIQSNISKPRRIRLEKVGDYVSMSISDYGMYQPTGGAFRIKLSEPFYVGLAVCAHNNDRIETALFKNVEIKTIDAPVPNASNAMLESTLEVVPISSGDRRVVYHRISDVPFAAPNWSSDNHLLFNDAGSLYYIPVDGSTKPAKINTGNLGKLNNVHGISPDGKWIAISDESRPGGSRIYLIPYPGGEPRLVTENAPSYWHGWSPDGKTLLYCAQRDGNYDVYAIPASGGQETRLTTAPGLDDGPEFSPDGQWIYFNSDRNGSMQIWRMKPDGTDQTQITNDEYNNWFAHPSPDGKSLAFLTYAQDVPANQHPANKDVMLRIMRTDGTGEIQTLAKLFGGQGTLNVPSWSPDSRRIAFVSYRLVPQEK
jgi:hypothetical protein